MPKLVKWLLAHGQLPVEQEYRYSAKNRTIGARKANDADKKLKSARICFAFWYVAADIFRQNQFAINNAINSAMKNHTENTSYSKAPVTKTVVQKAPPTKTARFLICHLTPLALGAR